MENQQVIIGQSPFFEKTANLKKLNSFITANKTFTPDEMALATGCERPDAMYIGVSLFINYHADGFLIVHDVDGEFIERRELRAGYADDNDCTYEFEFEILANIEFKTQ